MWKTIKKIFNKPDNEVSDNDILNKVDLFGKDNSVPEVSLDVLFAEKFNAGGGHFLYCENKSEAIHSLMQIVNFENITDFICLDRELQNSLAQIQVNFTENISDLSQEFSFLKCEFMCAYDGSIMISGHQTGGRKITDFPLNFIIWATPNQFALNLSDGLQKLRSLKKDNLPTNITCIRGKEMHSFSSIPNAKNIYLLLVDDLS